MSELGEFLTTRFQTKEENTMSTEAATAVSKSPEEISQLASEIQTRISSLESMFEDNLRGEMASLKTCLIENPSAAALLKDEDVGLLVKNLMRTVSQAVAEAVAGKAKAPKKEKTKLTKEEIEAALAADGL